MDIPLHPQVVAEIARGRDLLDRVKQARRAQGQARVVVGFPDGGQGHLIFDGEGLLVDADFSDDLFTRYPGDKLSDVLTEMCADGYRQVAALVTAAVQDALNRCGEAGQR